MSRSEAEGHQMWWCAAVLVLLIATCLVPVAVESVDVSGQTGHWITGATFYKAVVGAEETKMKADQELPLLLCAEIKLGSSIIC